MERLKINVLNFYCKQGFLVLCSDFLLSAFNWPSLLNHRKILRYSFTGAQ